MRVRAVHAMDYRLVTEIARFAQAQLRMTIGADLTEADEDAFELLIPWETWTTTVGGKRIADAYLEANGQHLSADEREWVEAQRTAWLSVWEVERVEVGTVHVRDLLTGERRAVREERGSQSLLARQTILTRVVDFQGRSYFGGTHSRPLSPREAAPVVAAVKKKLRRGKRTVHDREIAGYLIDTWGDTVEENDARRAVRPTLQNTDGDPVLFVTDSYSFDPTDRAAIEEAIEAMNDTEYVNETPVATELVAVRAEDETMLARLILMRDELYVETNSLNRADGFARRLQEACGAMLSGPKRETGALDFDAPRTEEPEEPEEPVDAEAIREYKNHYYREWLDTELPALDGKTPRAAARSKRTRAKVDLLLRDLEHLENHFPEDQRADIAYLRGELRLEP